MVYYNIKAHMNDTILTSEKINVTKDGLSIKSFQSGIACLYRKENSNLLLEVPINREIYPKVGFFQRRKHKDFFVEIFCVNTRVFPVKGLTSKMHFDATQSYRSVDLPIIYDIYFKVDPKNVDVFVEFAKKNFFGNAINYEEVSQNLTPIINSYIKKGIGDSEIYVVEDLETEMEEVEQAIVRNLNNSHDLKSRGILIDSIKIDVKDDFMARKEKKLIQGNKEIIK